MKTTFISVIALGVAVAMVGPVDPAAAEPMVLTDAQLDQVTAGMRHIDILVELGDREVPGMNKAHIIVPLDKKGTRLVPSITISHLLPDKDHKNWSDIPSFSNPTPIR